MFSSYLNGIWATDANNVYAVGYICFSMQPYRASSIIRWDGTKWNPINNLEGDFNGVYGFSKNNIWVVGSWVVSEGLKLVISHWNGNEWLTWKTKEYNNLMAIWGTDSLNIYAVGGKGLIMHYDGTSWIKQESGTDFLLNDIWGYDKGHIYVSGYDDSKGEGVLLQYDGFSWKKIAHGYPQDDAGLYGTFKSIWGDIDKIYFVGALCYEGKFNNFRLSNIPYNKPGDNIIGLSSMNRVRGDSQNNVFICGSRDLILHYNGRSWNLYYEFYSKAKSSRLENLWLSNKKVFIVGQSGDQRGLVYKGTQI